MKYKLTLTDENGNNHEFELTRSEGFRETMDDLILEMLTISPDKRKLPVKIQCPNDIEVYPSIKMKFENFGSPILGDRLESMHITWKD